MMNTTIITTHKEYLLGQKKILYIKSPRPPFSLYSQTLAETFFMKMQPNESHVKLNS